MNGFIRAMVVICLAAYGSLCGPPVAVATDRNGEVKAIHEELAAIKDQVNGLAKSVAELKAAVKALSGSLAAGTAKDSDDKPIKGQTEAQVRSTVCEAIETYIRSVDESLRLTDGVQAQSRMQRAYADLKNSVNRYAAFPEVNEIIGIGDDLDYDTYTDVSLRDSTEGTGAFVKSITSYKKRLKAYCTNR